MVETATNMDERARVRFFETDVGPVMNYVANNVYDQYEYRGSVFNPDRFIGVKQLADLLDAHTTKALESVHLSQASRDVINSMLETRVSASPHLMGVDEAGQHKLTFEEGFKRLLAEGVRSGVIMPLHVYIRKQLELASNYAEEVSARNLSTHVEIDDFADTLQNPHFQASLLHLARVRNGFYGGASTSFQWVGDFYFKRKLFANMRMFEPDSYALTDVMKAILKDNRTVSSEGCPVRRATYPVLGEHALRFAAVQGISQDTLRYQQQSAVVSGCNFIIRGLRTVESPKNDQ